MDIDEIKKKDVARIATIEKLLDRIIWLEEQKNCLCNCVDGIDQEIFNVRNELIEFCLEEF